jgi:hypothetical protein
VTDLTIPYGFLLGMLAGAGIVGAVIGWYLRSRRE